MIDLHSHILHGIDDGPATLEESVDLARELVAAGVTTVAATPHLREDHPGVVVDELSDRCDTLNRELALAGVDLDVVPGGEADLAWALTTTADDLRLASYRQRGTDLLLETPYGPLLPNFEEHLSRLAELGYRVLLAHPERNHTFQASPKRIAGLVEQGVLVQVTAGSLIGSPRESRSVKLAQRLLAQGLVHVLASDAHGAGVPSRPLGLDGIEEARSLVGARADWMVTEAPRAVLAGEPLPPPPAFVAPGRRSFTLPWKHPA